MRESTTNDDVKTFLENVDTWLDESVTVFLVGGTTLTIHALNARTEDIDMGFYVPVHFDHVHESLTTHGFTTIDEPTSETDTRGRTVLLQDKDLNCERHETFTDRFASPDPIVASATMYSSDRIAKYG